MKYFFNIFLLALFFSCSKVDVTNTSNPFLENVSSGTVTQVITFGGSLNDVASSVTATFDGGFAIAGTTQSNDGDITNKTNTTFDFLAVKFDENQEVIWQKNYGGSGDDRASKIIQTKDGGFIIVGSTTSSDGNISFNNGFRDFWVIKLNILGELLWEKTFGFSGNDYATTVIETESGEILVAGVLDVTASGGLGNSGRYQAQHAGGDYWLLKLTASGELIWSRYFGGTFTDTPFDISINSNNEIVLIGSSDSADTDISNNLGSYDFWTTKIDNNGDLIWEKSFGGSQIDEGRALLKVDGGYFLIGDTRSDDKNVSSNKGGADVWVASIDENGKISNDFSFGGSGFDVPRAAALDIDNNLIISGSSRSLNGDVSLNKGQNDVWVFKINLSGAIIWEKSIGGSNIDFSYDVTSLNDGSIIVVGESDSKDGDILENKGFTDALIIKIN